MDHYQIVPVALPRKQGYAYAKMDNGDYDELIKHKWRLSSSGYALFVKREGQAFNSNYMHKMIYGETCSHKNGDRLDNRRENLIPSVRSQCGPKRTAIPDGWCLAKMERLS